MNFVDKAQSERLAGGEHLAGQLCIGKALAPHKVAQADLNAVAGNHIRLEVHFGKPCVLGSYGNVAEHGQLVVEQRAVPHADGGLLNFYLRLDVVRSVVV